MGFHPFLGFLGIIGTILISWWAFVKPLLVCTYNLEPEASKRLLARILKDAKWKYVISSYYVKDPKVPHTFEAFVLLDGCFFYFKNFTEIFCSCFFMVVSIVPFITDNVDIILGIKSLFIAIANVPSAVLLAFTNGPIALG